MSNIKPCPELRGRVRDLVEREGVRAAARKLRLADATIARIVGDLPITEGVAFLAELRLREWGAV